MCIIGSLPYATGFRSLENKTPSTEALKRAHQKYMQKFVEVKVRMTPEQRTIIQTHATNQNESATAFINRAIVETMKRDNQNMPE